MDNSKSLLGQKILKTCLGISKNSEIIYITTSHIYERKTIEKLSGLVT